jgi:hypothetical protein
MKNPTPYDSNGLYYIMCSNFIFFLRARQTECCEILKSLIDFVNYVELEERESSTFDKYETSSFIMQSSKAESVCRNSKQVGSFIRPKSIIMTRLRIKIIFSSYFQLTLFRGFRHVNLFAEILTYFN